MESAPIRVGCSGWNYRHWRGPFYPAKLPVRLWFEHYSNLFDTVEINTSFYRLPAPETFVAWRDAAPPGFRYAVKAPRFLTHMKKLGDCGEAAAEFLERARLLGPRLGPILYQLPPRWKRDVERLRTFLDTIAEAGARSLDHVFEFREPSWLDDAVFALLEEKGASLCIHDMAGSATPRLAVGPVAYVRFHGGEGKYWGRYSRPVLEEWSRWLAEEADRGRAAWVYFNNDLFAHAIEDARVLRSLVTVRA